MLELTYPDVQNLFLPQSKRHTTESRAFLAWVLENIYRLEETEADDCVCDGPDDKGIDGIFANHESETIEVFQSKLYQNSTRTVGDSAFREFLGTLAQLRNSKAAAQLRDSTGNHELKGRIDELNLPELIGQGYIVRGILVTNADIDVNGRRFVEGHRNLSGLGRQEIDRLYVPAERVRPQTGQFEFDLSRYGLIHFINPQGIPVAIAPVPATQLVQLPGIDSGILFEPNLRQSLGRTKVNKEILESIIDNREHSQFLLYHNGITMVCEDLTADLSNQKIKIKNFYVVNGCQSLSSLYEKGSSVTDDLCMSVKIVKVGRDSELIDKITHRSNNQNVIKPRDFKSNHPIQVRLQNEFQRMFGGKVHYEIKRGERPESEIIIENDLAGRLLLSFDLRQPYTAHQSYKLFDDLYSDIFARPEVNAIRIYTIFRIYQIIMEELESIKDQSFAYYSLSRFFILHLVAEALRSTDWGRDFVQHPEEYVQKEKGFETLDVCIRNMLKDLITDLNGELGERKENQNPIDYKRELKSATAVGNLARAIVGAYQKLIGRGKIPAFEDEWNRVMSELVT